MKRYVYIIYFLICSFFEVGYSQPRGVIGIYWDGSNTYIAKADSAAGTVVSLHLTMVGMAGSNNASTTSNPYNDVFNFSNGKQIESFDINSGAFIDSSTIFPLFANEYFVQMEFNICDSSIYGIANRYSPFTARIARLNPYTGQLTFISLQSMGNISCGGCGSTIDPFNNIYYMDNGLNLVGVSLSTGQIITNVNTICPSGESFSRVEFNCADSTLYGLSSNSSLYTKYFSTVDPVTGIVNHVSGANLNNYFWKATWGGQTINPTGNEYYFLSGSATLVGVNISNGIGSNINLLPLNANQYLNYITFHPQCLCPTLLGIEKSINYFELNLFPNPFTSSITIQYNLTSPKETTVSLFNIYGQIVYSENLQGFQNLAGLNQLQIDMKDLEQGIYFVKINAGGKEEVKKVVKY